MAVDRQGLGLAIMRMLMGVFFIFEGYSKLAWLTNGSILAGRFNSWLNAPGALPSTRWYLEHLAMPGVTVFARLVPLGEFATGLALLVGFHTPLAAFIGLFMALNFHFASGSLFQLSFLWNGYGLPVIGSMIALMLGGKRTPLSIR